ncbi:MAG: hypothetical protein AB7S93_09025 [Xanthobacteraceae bacterium]
MADVLWNLVAGRFGPWRGSSFRQQKAAPRGALWRSQDSGGTETGASLGRHIGSARDAVSHSSISSFVPIRACVLFAIDFNQIRGSQVE